MTATLTLTAIPDIPDVQPGDELAGLLLRALRASPAWPLQPGDVLVVAQKIVSKAEGRFVRLSNVVPGTRALEVAAVVEKDPRVVELILRESDEISRMKPGVLVVRHRLGFTSANAGIDRSNVGADGEETVLLLPVDPDASAVRLRERIVGETNTAVAIVISDSHGRPFRLGTVGVAIGVAGIPALWDRRGEQDRYGYTLQHTDVGVADELAAAAGLLMGQGAEGLPLVLVRGLHVPQWDGRAADLVRPREQDLYR